MNEPSRTDLAGRAEIEKLVNAFYNRVRNDDLLGFIFDRVAHVDWETHLPKMYAFWETVMFRTGGFRGNPLVPHMQLAGLTTMGREQFDRWLTLFQGTVDDLFAGENAEHIKRCAEDMANVIHSRINAAKPGPSHCANLHNSPSHVESNGSRQ